MDWQKVIEELDRLVAAQEAITRDPYKHQAIKQAAATVGGILAGLSSALKAGVDHV